MTQRHREAGQVKMRDTSSRQGLKWPTVRTMSDSTSLCHAGGCTWERWVHVTVPSTREMCHMSALGDSREAPLISLRLEHLLLNVRLQSPPRPPPLCSEQPLPRRACCRRCCRGARRARHLQRLAGQRPARGEHAGGGAAADADACGQQGGVGKRWGWGCAVGGKLHWPVLA